MEVSTKHTRLLAINGKRVRKLLVDFIRDEVRNVGLRRGIIGLSGGVDSAVSCFLAVEALGRRNVLAVLLPYRTSSPGSLEDAQVLVEQLGIRSSKVDITTVVDAFASTVPRIDKVRKGNMMARARMIVLYDRSAEEKGLVIGTSNKTEILLGYTTHFGDNACGINPIGDLYKSQVWELAKELGVPENIIRKTPTADLWKGQTDEGELGVSYRELDRLLYHLVDERRSDEELQALGFSRGLVQKVKERIRRNQFKRRPPIIAKVSYRTVNVDFRYARDWGM